MNHLARKARGLRFGWNRRTQTEEDFHLLCRRFGVYLIETDSPDMLWNGFYTSVHGTPTIIINARLRGLMRLRTLFHELGHHLFHSPATCFFSRATINKAEIQARAFAIACLVPEPMLRRLLTRDLFEDDCYPLELLRERVELADQIDG